MEVHSAEDRRLFGSTLDDMFRAFAPDRFCLFVKFLISPAGFVAWEKRAADGGWELPQTSERFYLLALRA